MLPGVKKLAQEQKTDQENGVKSKETDSCMNVHLYLIYGEGVTASQGEKDGLFGKCSWQTWFIICIKINRIANTAVKSRL